jgi:hypothetical protein
MKLIAASALLLVLSAFQTNGADVPGSAAIVAQVLGKRITANEIGLKFEATGKPIISKDDPSSCAVSDPVTELIGKITAEILQDYVAKNNLKATDAEVQEFQISQERFMGEARARWQKESTELQERLRSDTLKPKEREDAKKRAATLAFNLQNETINGDLSKEDLRSIYAPFIEAWKFNKSVYERYGGTVAITKFGPDPVEATKRLLKEYERDKKLEVCNPILRKSFWHRLSMRPHLVAEKNEVNFTPYWLETKSQNER